MTNRSHVFGIIGAGISGIAAAKHCLEQGYKVIIFEKESSIGGVWLSKGYEGLKLQTTKNSYSFSDFPHFPSTGFYPNREELLNYFQEYCSKYDILKYCKLDTQVMKAKFHSDIHKWDITYQNKEGCTSIYTDFLIVASGFYTQPKIPNIVVSKNNKKVIHSSEFSLTGNYDSTIFKDKNVVIIGNGPTGCDMATLAHDKGAKNVTILYRTNRWIFRRFWGFGGSTDFMVSRFIQTMANILNTDIFVILMILATLFLELPRGNFSMKFKPPFAPPTRANLALNDKIVNYINYGSIDYIKAKDISVTCDNIIYNDEKQSLNYDLCIMATGFESNIPFLNFREIPNLYKRIIHPDLPNCCFIGFAPSFNWIQVSELQIQWYLHFIKKNNNISREMMNKQIKYECNNISDKAHGYHDLSTLSFEYCDSLLKDIGVAPKYNILSFKYWFKSPEYDYWSIKKTLK